MSESSVLGRRDASETPIALCHALELQVLEATVSEVSGAVELCLYMWNRYYLPTEPIVVDMPLPSMSSTRYLNDSLYRFDDFVFSSLHHAIERLRLCEKRESYIELLGKLWDDENMET